jgi:hypothetical protein
MLPAPAVCTRKHSNRHGPSISMRAPLGTAPRPPPPCAPRHIKSSRAHATQHAATRQAHRAAGTPRPPQPYSAATCAAGAAALQMAPPQGPGHWPPPELPHHHPRALRQPVYHPLHRLRLPAAAPAVVSMRLVRVQVQRLLGPQFLLPLCCRQTLPPWRRPRHHNEQAAAAAGCCCCCCRRHAPLLPQLRLLAPALGQRRGTLC